MIEELEEGIYRIGVPLPRNSLKELNCYFIRGDERDLVIDTGFNFDECREALFSGLAQLGSDIDRRDVFLTHFHADHSGLASECVGENGRIFISTVDAKYLKWSLDRVLIAENDVRLLKEGFPKDELRKADETNQAYIYQMRNNDPRISCVNEGDVLCVGKYTFQMIQVPGHTPGSMMLWEADKGFMFTGDHVLFDITPNITCWYKMKDSLGAYLDSLRKVHDYPVVRAFPGHRKSGDYQKRIDELLAHHARRIGEALETISAKPGLSAYDISPHLSWNIRAKSWKEFPAMQKYFAVRECVAHLDHLLEEGKIECRMEEGINRYYVSAS